MRKNIDILLGLVAWAIGVFTIAEENLFDWQYEYEWKRWIGPGLWLLCVMATYVFKTRKSWKLFWVWLSFPLAFAFWIFVGLAFWAWSHSGFAP